MNPFRSRKKSFAEGEAGKTRPSLDNAPAMPSFTSGRGMTFRKKKQAPEPKPELNLQDVLPSSDNFRTSLLMPNLSARFSMLREQDDPNSKLGKANDDSVLFPRRHSKLGLFASEDNQDGYGTDDGGSVHGSIMSRAKPGQGNKFFGGRQVVYKVPMDGKRQVSEEDKEALRPMGKAMYNDDISMSTFQKLRQERKLEERESLDRGERSSNENFRSGSPPLSGYNRKRETSSSTNSGPPEGRTSTAATSIASQPGVSWYASGNSSFGTKPSPVTTPGSERPPKGKRLYGQGLDQQMLEQQSSTVNRLNSAQRNGRSTPGTMGLSRSTSNLNERFQKSSMFHPVTDPRSNSPSPAVQSAGLGGFDFSSSGTQQSRSASKDREGVARETPPMSPMGDPLAAALNANDVGKATASGAFNKPKTQYNEQQYTQRQFQLQEGRDTPPIRSISRQDQQSEYSGRMRNGSMASVQSGSSSKQQYRTNQGSRAPSSASNYKARASPVDSNQPANGAYYADSGSEYGSHSNSPEPELPTLKPSTYKKPSTENLTRSTIYEHDDQHPAFRNQPADRLYIEPSDSEEDKSSYDKVNQNDHNLNEERKVSMDSPTLGGIDGNDGLGAGLSDLVKGHLRNHSNASSVYPNSPGMDQENSDDWNKTQNGYLQGRPSFDKTAMPPPLLGDRARQVLQQANQLANANAKAHDVLGGIGSDKVSQILGPEVPRRSNESARGWQDHVKGHSRGASTETQKEREDFASELADRRKLVQEKLKNFAEDSSKPSSSSSESGSKPGTFGSLLKKSSRGSLVRGNDDSNKAAKTLGIGNNYTSNGSSADNHASRGDGTGKMGVNSDSSSYRNVGAERREKFFRKGSNPHQHIDRFNTPDAAPPPPPAPFGFQRSRTDPANQPMSFHPAGRARKYSPPRPTTVAPGSDIAASEPNSLANSAAGHLNGSSKSPAGSYFPPQHFSSNPNTPVPQSIGFPSVGPPPRLPQGYSNGTPPKEYPTGPTMISPSSQSRADKYLSNRKRSVSKHDISEPTFLSGTSSVTTVDLPPGANLGNGMDGPPMSPPKHAPPVPPINPRRKYPPGPSGVQMTQNLFTAFGGKSPNMPPGMNLNGTHSQPGSAHPDYAGSGKDSFDYGERERERSSGDKPRARLRKISSEGGSMAAKARHQALMRDADTMGMVR